MILSELPSQAIEKHVQFHYPTLNGVRVEPVPYLTLPFRREDVSRTVQISEGWDYSADELGITGYENHKATDFATETGTPVVSPCNALAIASYHTHAVLRTLMDGSQEIVTYHGKPVGSGLGLFVQLYIPEQDRYLQLGHLDSISLNIPFSPPEDDGSNGWQPTNYNLPPQLITSSNPMIVPVRRGDFLGTVGTSGLTLGYIEYDQKLNILDVSASQFSWDIPHLHVIESARRLNSAGTATVKTCARDLYDLYNYYDHYPTTKTIGQGDRKGLGPEPLFYLDESGLPLYADDIV